MSLLPPAMVPASYVPYSALAYSTGEEGSVSVGQGTPLPVAAAFPPATSTALSGSTGTSALVGPFAPDMGRTIWLTLSGTWVGKIKVLRSTDGGTTMHGLTVAGKSWAEFTTNVNEPVTEETVSGATYYLDIQLLSGTLAYQVAQ